jgi:hypothetical protein
MSDSLNATVIVNEPVSTIVAKALLEPEPEEDDEPDKDEPAPRLPADALPPPAPPAAPPPELDDEPLPEEAVPEFPAETGSPGERLASETIVPATGAYRLVLVSACCALWRFASAL